MHWTTEDDAVLRERGKPYAQVAALLGRSTTSVQKRAIRLGLTASNKPWSKQEDLMLRGAATIDEAMDALPHRTPDAVRKRAERVGVLYEAQEASLRRVGSRGYVHIKIRGKWRPEHRVVAERAFGRKLHTYEHVHHIDGCKDNNDPDNLFVCSNVDHALAHRSLLDILRPLMDAGAVTFDRERGQYICTAEISDDPVSEMAGRQGTTG